MNILYINHYAGSLSLGMEFRPFYLAREFEKRGHKVRIIGADYSHLRSTQPIIDHDFEIQVIDGIEYQWVKAGSYSSNGIKRAITMISFVSKLVCHSSKIIKSFKPDLVITSSTYPLDSYAGYRIARKANAEYVHEAHDVWPLTLIELGGMSRWNPFVVLLSIAEKHAYKHAERIISVLPNAVEHMVDVFPKAREKFSYIPNGIVKEDWDTAEPVGAPHLDVFHRLHSEGKLIICYAGGITKFDKTDMILDVAKKYNQDDSVAFVVVGKGMEKDALIKRVESEGIKNVYFLPAVPKKQVPSVLHESDALFISLPYCSLYRYGVSINKVYDYMMAGKPILYGVNASNNEVEEAGCGVSFNCDSVDSLYSAIEKVRQMSEEERNSLGSNGKTWVLKNCEYSVLADKFLEVVNHNKKGI